MKILALQLKRIGDLILTTPALSALREAQPEAQITLVHDHKSAQLVEAMPFVDDSLAWGGESLGFWPTVLRRGYDVCLDFTGNDRSALIAFLSKATRRIAFEWVHKAAFRPLFYNEFIDSNVLAHHTTDHYLHLVAPLGAPQHARPIHLEIPKASELRAEEVLQKNGINGAFAVVHPGSARAEKYWPPERWAEVVDFCHGKGLRCVITGADAAHEQQQIARLKEAVTGQPPADLSGKLDLLGFAALVRKARLLLSVDSAAMHFAAASRIPQVALFGLTNPYHWRPLHKQAVVVSAEGADPAPRIAGAPMKEISTHTVTAAITRLLQHV